MTKLSDTQRVILSRAAQHEALLATPPAKLPAVARQAVLRSMIAKGLLQEVPAPREAIALGWRQDEGGAWIALRVTPAGLTANGVEPEGARHGTDEPPDTAAAPVAPQEDSLTAFPPTAPADSGGAPQGPKRPPASQHGPIGRAAALRMAAAKVLAAWDASERDGLDDAIAALRTVVHATPRAARTARPPRDTTRGCPKRRTANGPQSRRRSGEFFRGCHINDPPPPARFAMAGGGAGRPCRQPSRLAARAASPSRPARAPILRPRPTSDPDRPHPLV